MSAPAAVAGASSTGRPTRRARRRAADRLLAAVLATRDAWEPFLARTVLGVVLLPHGAQKLLGAFGGDGPGPTMAYFTGPMGIPAPLAALVIATESLGALALVLGLFGRVAALGVACVLGAGALLVHAPHGFFMNWSGAQRGEGVEYHLLGLALAAIVVGSGSGRLSLDRVLSRGIARRPAPADAP